MSENNDKRADWLEKELEEKEEAMEAEAEAAETAEENASKENSGSKSSPSETSFGKSSSTPSFLKESASKRDPAPERPSARRASQEDSPEAEEEEDEEKDTRKLLAPSDSKRRIFMILGAVALIVIVVLFLLSDRIFNRVQGKSSYVLTETDKAVTYIEGNTNVLMHNGKLLRCSQDGVQALNESGTVAWDIPFTMSSPYMVTAGNYISVADRLGMSMIVITGGQVVTEITTESQLLLNCVNAKGMTAAVLDASEGHMVNLYSAEGETLMQRRTYSTTDGIPLAVALSEDGSRMGTVYVNYTNAVMTSIITIFDLTETGSSLVDRIVGSVAFEDTLISDIKFVGNNQCFYCGTNLFGLVTTRTSVDKVWETEVHYEIEALAMGESFFAVRYGEGLAGTVLPAQYNVVSYSYDKGTVLTQRNVENVNYLDVWGDTIVYAVGRTYTAISSTGKPKWNLQAYEEYSRMVQFDSDKTVAALRSGVIRFYKVTLKGVGEDAN